MRRRFIAGLLTAIVAAGLSGGVAAPAANGSGAAAAKVIAFGTFYRPVSFTNQVSFICEASVFGGLVVVYTQITACSMTSSNGGYAKGVTPVIYPGLEAITGGVGGFNKGVYTVCMTAKARYGDGTILTQSVCEIATFLKNYRPLPVAI